METCISIISQVLSYGKNWAFVYLVSIVFFLLFEMVRTFAVLWFKFFLHNSANCVVSGSNCSMRGALGASFYIPVFNLNYAI